MGGFAAAVVASAMVATPIEMASLLCSSFPRGEGGREDRSARRGRGNRRMPPRRPFSPLHQRWRGAGGEALALLQPRLRARMVEHVELRGVVLHPRLTELV